MKLWKASNDGILKMALEMMFTRCPHKTKHQMSIWLTVQPYFLIFILLHSKLFNSGSQDSVCLLHIMKIIGLSKKRWKTVFRW